VRKKAPAEPSQQAAEAAASSSSSSPSASPVVTAALAKRYPYIALVKENVDNQVREFSSFLPPHGIIVMHPLTNENVYREENPSLYHALGSPKLSMWDLISWKLIQRFRSADKIVGGNMKGEGMIKGAIFISDVKKNSILLTAAEKTTEEVNWPPIEEAIKQLIHA